MPFSVSVLADHQIEAHRTRIVAIYRDAFLPPPYNKPEAEVVEFARWLPRHVGREAFRFVGAFEGGSEQLVGFAYGYASAAGQWWYDVVRPALPGTMAAPWLADSFQFAEIAVDPRVQGRGIGGRLHDQLLRGVRQERAVLSTLQADTVAHHLYRRRGWVVLRQDFFFPGVARRYQIMGLELKPGSQAA